MLLYAFELLQPLFELSCATAPKKDEPIDTRSSPCLRVLATLPFTWRRIAGQTTLRCS